MIRMTARRFALMEAIDEERVVLKWDPRLSKGYVFEAYMEVDCDGPYPTMQLRVTGRIIELMKARWIANGSRGLQVLMAGRLAMADLTRSRGAGCSICFHTRNGHDAWGCRHSACSCTYVPWIMSPVTSWPQSSPPPISNPMSLGPSQGS